MYSEMTKMLGMSQGMLEGLVLSGIAVAVLGVVLVLFWKYVLAGVGVLFCVVVLANHRPTEEPKEEIVSIAKAEVVAPTPTAPVMPDEKSEKDMFLEDCLEYTDYSKKKCEFIWNNRGIEEVVAENVKLLDVNNKEYKKRRALALQKKNAVVIHTTL